MCVCPDICNIYKINHRIPNVKYTARLRFTSLVNLNKFVHLTFVRPCKPCNQTIGRNFRDILMKFGT